MKLLILTQVVDKNNPILGFFTRWLDLFAKNVEHLEIICLEKGDYEIPKNAQIHSLGKETRTTKIVRIIRFYRYIFSLRKNYDAVFVHMNPIYVILGAPIWKLWNKKIVLWYMHKNVSFVLRTAEKLVDAICTGSKESFRLASKKVHILGHGIEVESIAISTKTLGEEIEAVTIGRISPIKGYDEMLSAVASIQKKYPEKKVHLRIVGGPGTPEQVRYEQKLKARVKKGGLETNIEFLGPVPHAKIPSLLQTADVFVNLSDTGSLDKAVLEAMAAGVPSLTSNPAFKEMLQPLGLMVQKDNPEDLAEKILLVSQKKSELSQKLRSIVLEKHSLTTLIPKIIKIIGNN